MSGGRGHSIEIARAFHWVETRTCNVPSVTLDNGEVVYQIKHYPFKVPDNPPIHIDRDTSLGLFSCLSYYELTSFIDDILWPDIGSILALGCTSRAWNWYTSNEKLWKYFTKTLTKGNIEFSGNWKQSLLFHLNTKNHKARGEVYVPSEYKRDDPSIPPYWTGMQKELARSFKFWYRASINPRYWDVSCPRHIDRIHYKDISVEEFIQKYEIPGKPVIIAGISEQWEAPKYWNAKTLSERHKDVKWRCGSGWKMTIPGYMSYLKNRTDPLSLYLFDRRYHKIAPEILQEYKIPDYFPEDIFALAGPKKRPPYRWILIGPGGSTVPYHVDPQGTSAWNVVVKGKKRWGFYPPGHHPPAVGAYDPDYYNAPSGIKWLLNVLPLLPANQLPIECIQEEGDLLFVPSGWWHLVYNVNSNEEGDDGLCIAMTHNYCSSHNFERVAALLIDDDDSNFGDTLRDILETERPDLYQRWLKVEDRLETNRAGIIKELGLVIPLEKESQSSSYSSSCSGSCSD
eukprot:TRINITY_DN15276_c0_g1_i1.p1 TRINITY_DN15276_c0_g1~~TRINITY_DN15276_c0_g1_i1.p1  ORF type:complete len:521 (+),score=75.88 TRINITY_DN15276_c0_g1_i1:27-1565(+)